MEFQPGKETNSHFTETSNKIKITDSFNQAIFINLFTNKLLHTSF